MHEPYQISSPVSHVHYTALAPAINSTLTLRECDEHHVKCTTVHAQHMYCSCRGIAS